jgi:hypothetical protein
MDLGGLGYEVRVNSTCKTTAKYALNYDVSLSERIVICVCLLVFA